jgi:hypothetical protein
VAVKVETLAGFSTELAERAAAATSIGVVAVVTVVQHSEEESKALQLAVKTSVLRCRP